MGMDNNIAGEDQEKKEEMAPGFSTSAMRYVNHLIKKNTENEDDEVLDDVEQDSENDECLLEDEEEV